ncbi:hypothetical protein FRC09_020630 [Ceratobasidium sp. 395]|nr:hypothetical protein FRC09_020630 [Ceratobasidium sp. 395]
MTSYLGFNETSTDPPLLKAIQFGVLRNRTFSIEYSRDLASFASYLKFENDRRSLEITLGGVQQSGTNLAVIISVSSVRQISIGHDGGDDYMLFELAYHPRFEQIDQSRRSRTRLSRLDEDHGRVSPYVSRWIRIVFHEDTPSIPTEDSCFQAGLPRPDMAPQLIFDPNRQVYSQQNINLVDDWLRNGSLPWEVAFQCEALFRNGDLVPKEITLLRPQVEMIVRESPNLVRDTLKAFQAALKGTGVRALLFEFEDPAIVTLFEKCLAQAKQAGRSGHLQNSSLTFVCHHVKVTPTAIYLDGPYAEQSNRVIRRYPGFESHFIRVSFKDEGGGWIRLGFGPNAYGSSKDWVNRTLKADGVNICGREYKLLSYRSADLREHTCFFGSDFIFEGAPVTPESIRASLGDFSEVINYPSRYGSRLSQAFSSTDPSIVLSPELIKYIPDIKSADGESFSNGCGTISRALAERVWQGWLDKLPHTRRRQRHKDEPIPAVFQMRIGGSMGVVRIDPKLAGEQLCIRPSMTKLEVPNELSFEIVRTSERPSPCILNRSLIMLLSTNGVNSSSFEKLMGDTLDSISTAMKTFDGARTIFAAHQLGSAFRLDSSFAKLSCLGLELHQPGVQDVGLRKLLDAGSYHVKLGLKLKGRIQVPDSYTLVGHACRSLTTELARPILNISKAGFLFREVQIFTQVTVRDYAIGNPPADSPFAGEGNHLPNCVVFSSRGPRPVPYMLGGGDLGKRGTHTVTQYATLDRIPTMLQDLFNIIRSPELMPSHEYTPASSYSTGIPIRTLSKESTIEDVAEFMVDYMCNDNVGLIISSHLIIASMAKDGVRNENCLINAELHTKAVDFSKTGMSVSNSQIRKPRYSRSPATGQDLRPDWTAGRNPVDENYYPCSSVLGSFFKAVSLPPGNPARDDIGILQNSDKSNAILKRLATHVAKYQAQIKESYAAATLSIQALLARYTIELNHICISHTVASESTEHVSEAEVMLGTNLESAENKSLIERMKLQTENLTEFVRLQLRGSADDDPHNWLARSWRAYTLASSVGYEKFGAFSFSWIALGSVLDALCELDQNFLPDISAIQSLLTRMTIRSEDARTDPARFPQSDRENWTWTDETEIGHRRGNLFNNTSISTQGEIDEVHHGSKIQLKGKLMVKHTKIIIAPAIEAVEAVEVAEAVEGEEEETEAVAEAEGEEGEERQEVEGEQGEGDALRRVIHVWNHRIMFS